MNIVDIVRLKNRILCAFMPNYVAKFNANFFLTPRNFKLKEWEHEAEARCERLTFGEGLSAASWGEGERKVMIVHGWESRATQMYAFVEPLVDAGYQVIAIDAPLHGRSGGSETHPVAFARAILAASNELGPFEGVIGHSMGGAAISIAMELGAKFERSVLISAPSCMYDVLKAFGQFMGLSETCQRRFIRTVENKVGRPSKELDVGKIFAELQPEALLVHADNDREIPHRAMQTIAGQHPGVQTLTVNGLGHRKILRDPDISATIANYISTGALSKETESLETA